MLHQGFIKHVFRLQLILTGVKEEAIAFSAECRHSVSRTIAMTATAPLHQHHQHCDELFASAEASIADQDWTAGEQAVTAFIGEMERHFRCEEETLFPAFEAATGMTGGPTSVMRHEHTEMRDLMQAMQAALAARNGDDFAGVAETLLIFMQQHNMKEENILYPMCDRHVPDTVAEQVAQCIAPALPTIASLPF